MDQESVVLEAILFSQEPPTAAVQMKELQDGKLTPTILAALKRVASSHDPLVFENQSLADTSKREGNSFAIASDLNGRDAINGSNSNH